jgi:hypothetical protein
VSRNEAGSEARLYCCFCQCHTQVRLAHPARSQEDHVAGFVDEPQRSQLSDLALLDRGLESEVELVEGLYELRGGRSWKPYCRLDEEVFRQWG